MMVMITTYGNLKGIVEKEIEKQFKLKNTDKLLITEQKSITRLVDDEVIRQPENVKIVLHDHVKNKKLANIFTIPTKASIDMESFYKKNENKFCMLLVVQHNITRPILAKVFEISKNQAGMFIDFCVKKGLLEQYHSFWRATDQGKQLKNEYVKNLINVVKGA